MEASDLAQLRALADAAGLVLDDAELEELAPQLAPLRAYVELLERLELDEVEPAAVFICPRTLE